MKAGRERREGKGRKKGRRKERIKEGIKEGRRGRQHNNSKTDGEEKRKKRK